MLVAHVAVLCPLASALLLRLEESVVAAVAPSTADDVTRLRDPLQSSSTLFC